MTTSVNKRFEIRDGRLWDNLVKCWLANEDLVFMLNDMNRQVDELMDYRFMYEGLVGQLNNQEPKERFNDE